MAEEIGGTRWMIPEGIASDVPVVVQHTRLDSRQAEKAPMTTIAFPDTQ